MNHPVVGGNDDFISDQYSVVDGIWDGRTTGNPDLDEMLRKHNEELKEKRDKFGHDEGTTLDETGIEEIEEEVMQQVDKIPIYGQKIHKLLTWLWWMRYWFNLAFVAIPWALYFVIFIGYNLFVNITWNRWWAGGNAYLIAVSVYHLLMGLHSIFLIFEFDAYLRWTIYIRPFI